MKLRTALLTMALVAAAAAVVATPATALSSEEASSASESVVAVNHIWGCASQSSSGTYGTCVMVQPGGCLVGYTLSTTNPDDEDEYNKFVCNLVAVTPVDIRTV